MNTSPNEEDHQMADEISMALDELVRKDGVRTLAQAPMEAEVSR